jgi:hypothetical protein
MGEADYYILIGGNETGPWTLGQVQAFWRAGAVTLETLYAQPGTAEWKPLSAILDVAPPTAPTPTRLKTGRKQGNRSTPVAPTPTPQQENNPAILDADDTAGKPEQPGEMDLTKLRQWLREKLAAIGLAPDTKKATANERKFESWLCRFTDSEQKAIYGANNIRLYRIRDMTWQGLIQELECLAASAAEKPHSDGNQLTPENALWIIDAVCGAEPMLELDVEKYRRMGAAEGGAGILKQRAERIAQQLGIKSAESFKAGEGSAAKANAITTERRRLRALGIMEEPHA